MTKARVSFDIDLAAYPHLNNADDLRRMIESTIIAPSMRAAQQEFHQLRVAEGDNEQKAVGLAGRMLAVKLVTNVQQGLSVDMIAPQ